MCWRLGPRHEARGGRAPAEERPSGAFLLRAWLRACDPSRYHAPMVGAACGLVLCMGVLAAAAALSGQERAEGVDRSEGGNSTRPRQEGGGRGRQVGFAVVEVATVVVASACLLSALVAARRARADCRNIVFDALLASDDSDSARQPAVWDSFYDGDGAGPGGAANASAELALRAPDTPCPTAACDSPASSTPPEETFALLVETEEERAARLDLDYAVAKAEWSRRSQPPATLVDS